MTGSEPRGATPLDPEEREGLRHRHVRTRGELDELEQGNIEQGLLWLMRARNVDLFDDAFIRGIHKRLFGDVWQWAGEYRATEKSIGVAPHMVSTELRTLLDDARFWAEEKTYAPLEAAGRFHHRMVKIHPFPNGNGRHARICVDAMLARVYDHPAINWSKGRDLQVDNGRRDEYIAALRAADGNDYAPLFAFIGFVDPP